MPIRGSTPAAAADHNPGMRILTSTRPFAWRAPDVPVTHITCDWHGAPLPQAAGFSLVADSARLWFIARHRGPATAHPMARPGGFQAELWRYDVAELFIAHPSGASYLEFNLAPNGAWWSCAFTAPRVRAAEEDAALPGVTTHAELTADGAWRAAMAIPLELLRELVGYGPGMRANVTFILGHPRQVLLTAADLGGGEPDFHRPQRFPQVSFAAMPAGHG